ncbi:hypothetical protein H0H81_011999, partial [Sphagnurus paluster]
TVLALKDAAPSTQPTSTWTKPPWSGCIETTGDALLILEAARRGLIPRVTRRLVDSERKMITSGFVFVFDEDESGIKRWTDGIFWSPCRILGKFLLYRETDKRDGLMKTFSLTIDGVSQHLISYYKIQDVTSERFRPPSSLPEFASLDISPKYLDKTHFRNPLKVEIGVDGRPRYCGEADDIDSSSPLSPALFTALPLLTDGRVTESPNTSKRANRFEPYRATVSRKRPRKQTMSSIGDPATPADQQQPQEAVVLPPIQPSSGYVNANT